MLPQVLRNMLVNNLPWLLLPCDQQNRTIQLLRELLRDACLYPCAPSIIIIIIISVTILTEKRNNLRVANENNIKRNERCLPIPYAVRPSVTIRYRAFLIINNAIQLYKTNRSEIQRRRVPASIRHKQHACTAGT